MAPATYEAFGPDLATIGALRLPATFSLHVYEPNPRVANDYLFDVALMYGVNPGDNLPELRAVWSLTHEVPEALDILRAERSLPEWRRVALMMLAAAEAESAGQEVSSAIRLASDTPASRRYDRITPDLLREVAEVYQSARAAGEPTTKAVAQRFFKADATAAKWVWRARKDGFLPPFEED